MVPISYYLVISAVMFIMGAIGFMVRKNSIVAFMCIELMLNAVNLSFVALSRGHANMAGQISVFFVMVVAAAEAAVGLAIIISVFRAIKSVETTDSSELRA